MKKLLAIALFFVFVGCSNNSNPVGGYVFNYAVKEGKLENMPDSSCYAVTNPKDTNQQIFNWRIKINYSMTGPVYYRDLRNTAGSGIDSSDVGWKISSSIEWYVGGILIRSGWKGMDYRIYYIP